MNFEEFKAKFEKVPIDVFSNQVQNDPVVSVCVMTYQHVNYIKECLDGILMQQTNFPFEILLGEDGSTDGTREICIQYAEKHPDKIRLFLHHRENNIKINGNLTGRFNCLYNLYCSNGKYVALCEGDDYWTDPLKLQKQVDFMELNPEYSFSMGKFKIFLQSKNIIRDPVFSHVNPNVKEDYLLEDFIFSHFSHTSTYLFRNIYKGFDFPNWFMDCPGLDHPLVAVITDSGKIKYHHDYFSVYRIHPGGIHRNKGVLENFFKNQWLQNINRHYQFKYTHIIKFRCKLLSIGLFAQKTNSKIVIQITFYLCRILTLVYYKVYRLRHSY